MVEEGSAESGVWGSHEIDPATPGLQGIGFNRTLNVMSENK